MIGRSHFVAAALAFAVLSTQAMAASTKDWDDCVQSSDPDRKIAGCTQIVNDRSELRVNRAVAFNNRGNGWADKTEADLAIISNSDYYNRAISDFSESIRLNPKVATTYNNRGSVFRSIGEFDRAITDYNESIRQNPKYAIAYNNRAAAWWEKRDFDRALSDSNESLRLDPKYADAYNARGSILRDKGELDRAIADYTEAIRLRPNLGRYYASRGDVWRLKGDLDHALLDQDEAVRLSPKNIYTYYQRATTHRYRGDFSLSLADYDRMLVLNPSAVEAFTGRGLTYERMGDLTRARVEFEKAIASKSAFRFDVHAIALETAKTRLAALDSGAVQPVIPAVPSKLASTTSIPTPAVSLPAAVTAPKANRGRRVALVIGNSAYTNVPALLNPERDATVIAATLRSIGFDVVTLATNLAREKMIGSLNDFAKEAEKSDWAMVYYSGHGMEVGGVNYLVPIDARIAVDRDIKQEAVPLPQVLSAATARKIKLVVLDACRDDPFKPRRTEPDVVAQIGSTAGAPIATRSTQGRGLAEVRVQGATLVVYAAKDGQVALDGDGDNSPFAVAMAQRIGTPGVEINKVFRLVRDDVMEATAGRQEPYTYGSLPGSEDFFFVPK